MRKLFLLPLLAISLVSCQTSGYTQLKEREVLTIFYGSGTASYFQEEHVFVAYQEKSNGIVVQHRKESEKVKVDTFKGKLISWVVWEN